MPEPKPKKNGAPKPVPKLKIEVADRPVLYQELEVCGVKIPEKNTWLNEETLDALLGWEDEDAAQERIRRKVAADFPQLKGAELDKAVELAFEKECDACPHTLLDEDKKRVWLRNNCTNRRYDDALSKRYTQDMLNAEWQFNCETWIVGKTGLTMSLQHRGTAAKRAFQLVRKQHQHWGKKWPDGFKIRALVAFGVDETDAVIASLDNVRTRDLADTAQTRLKSHPLFAKLDKRDYDECCRMMKAAINLFWVRTHAPESDGDRKYQTHASSLAMLDRHAKLHQAVSHIHETNKDEAGRRLSVLNVSPGQCAAMLYLMGASATDGDEYRNARPTPSEKKCDLSRWDKAEEFWTLLAAREESVKPLAEALSHLKDLHLRNPDKGCGGTTPEKLGLIAKAWKFWIAGEAFTEADLMLDYMLKDGEPKLALGDWPDGTVEGIDLGQHDEAEEKKDGEQDGDVVEASKEVVRAEKAQEAIARVEASKKPKGGPAMQTAASNGQPPAPSLTDIVADVMQRADGRLVVFRGTMSCTLFGAHADQAKDALGLKTTKDKAGLTRIDFTIGKMDEQIAKLFAGGHKVAIRHGDGSIVDAKPPADLKALPAGLPSKVLKKPLNRREPVAAE